jgi:hypothetical protein
MISVMNLGEALEIAKNKTRRTARNPYQKDYLKKRMEEPGWWKRQLRMQNQRRRNNGVS